MPNLANVIPVMDIINDRLTAKANDTTLSPAIRSALGLAKKTLNRYYSKTDNSEAYRIAMSMFIISFMLGADFSTVLHPQYKLQYFKDANWEAEWIKTAEELVHAQFEASYRKDNINTEDDSLENTMAGPSVCA
jgi:hypothetical protein